MQRSTVIGPMVEFQKSVRLNQVPFSLGFWLIVLRCEMSQETRDMILGLALTIAAFLAMAIALNIALESI